MTWENMPWVIGLLVAAVLVAVLNDRTKPKEARRKAENAAPGSTLGLWIGVVVVAGVSVLSAAFGRDFPAIRWIIPLVFAGIVLLAVLFALRELIWLYLKSAVTGQFPHTTRRNADGQLVMKCPSCSGKVSVTPGRLGETAFECPHCGEKAMWASEMKS